MLSKRAAAANSAFAGAMKSTGRLAPIHCTRMSVKRRASSTWPRRSIAGSIRFQVATRSVVARVKVDRSLARRVVRLSRFYASKISALPRRATLSPPRRSHRRRSAQNEEIISMRRACLFLSLATILIALNTTVSADPVFVNGLVLSGGRLDATRRPGANAGRLGFFSDVYYDPVREEWWAVSDRDPGGGVLDYETRVQRFTLDVNPVTRRIAHFRAQDPLINEPAPNNGRSSCSTTTATVRRTARASRSTPTSSSCRPMSPPASPAPAAWRPPPIPARAATAGSLPCKASAADLVGYVRPRTHRSDHHDADDGDERDHHDTDSDDHDDKSNHR